mmetsp:Transcript_142421/g.346097  ORF Transcript_142421/g.346097 Transcript_142421/m.346097 type:complete len:109 (+) Transcript_142421:2050-2376(+)
MPGRRKIYSRMVAVRTFCLFILRSCVIAPFNMFSFLLPFYRDNARVINPGIDFLQWYWWRDHYTCYLFFFTHTLSTWFTTRMFDIIETCTLFIPCHDFRPRGHGWHVR